MAIRGKEIKVQSWQLYKEFKKILKSNEKNWERLRMERELEEKNKERLYKARNQLEKVSERVRERNLKKDIE